jgi:hypothetical protein
MYSEVTLQAPQIIARTANPRIRPTLNVEIFNKPTTWKTQIASLLLRAMLQQGPLLCIYIKFIYIRAIRTNKIVAYFLLPPAVDGNADDDELNVEDAC